MAIETNKRKRKHKNVDKCDEAQTDLPKKQHKKMKVSKKATSEPSLEEQQIEQTAVNDELNGHGESEANAEMELQYKEPNHDSGFEREEREIKFSLDFKMLNFRTKLRGTNFITELRHFLYLTKARPKIVAKYIEKRGKPLELAEAMERIDKTNLLHASYLCQALQLVIMEILSEQKSHMESAVHACRYFLKTHSTVMEQLLKSGQVQHRRIALKLLTAIVCVEPQLGRQVLSSFDVLSNERSVNIFLSHNKHELQEEETVRKCFIHFVLSYLVDGNTLLIRNILDRGSLIRALVAGLIYDDHVTVCVVLSTLQKYVLECSEISKTKKINVFDFDCCKCFARLYNWHGPKVYAAKFTGKKAELSEQQIEAMIDAGERDAVAAAVHKFLVVLLTSRKHGITFDAITHFRQKRNLLQGKLIGFLYKPWLDTRKTELIVKVLQACPELGRQSVRVFGGVVNPLRTSQKEFIQGVNFLAEIINTLHPKLLQKSLDNMTLTDFSNLIKDNCLPLETLVHITGSKMLRHVKYPFRLAINRLLIAMFTQYANYMAAISKREQSKGANTIRRFKFDILNHILVNFPTMEEILYSLHMTIKLEEPRPADILVHLELTLDLVLILCRENRSFVNKTSTILDYLSLLRPLYANDKTPMEQRDNIKLELKAIKAILLVFPKALEPKEKLFANVLKSFIKAFVYGTPGVQREAGELLRGIFRNTDIFDAGELEIDLWLEALRCVDSSETVETATQVFIEVLQVTNVAVDAPKTAQTIANEKNLYKLFENIESGLSAQGYIETLSISKLMPLIFKGVEIVKPLDKYLETVLLLMYHYYPTPESVLQLYTTHFRSLTDYMASWLPHSNTKVQQIQGKIAAKIPHLKEVQASILVGTPANFDGLFAAQGVESSCEIELDGKLLKYKSIVRNERMLMIYVQQVLFMVAQLVEKQQLQHSQAERAAAFLLHCLRLVQQLETSEETDSVNTSIDADTGFSCKMLKYIFSIRLSYIQSADLFSAGVESHLHYLHFLREMAQNCNAMAHFDTYAANYRQKIVKAVAISMQSVSETKAQTDKLAESIKLVEAINLNAENCVEILELIATKLNYTDFFEEATMQKTVYYELLVCVLERLASLQVAVRCDVFMKKFMKFYTKLIKKFGQNVNIEQAEEALYNFLLVSHQYIPEMDGKFFDCMFLERKLTKSSIKLASLLLDRDEKLHEAFKNHLPHNLSKRELVYPLMSIAFRKHLDLEAALLQTIYQEYKNGFMKTIEKPQKAGVIYKEHVECSIALIQLCMPKSECVDFCNKQLKFDVIEPFQMRIIQAIYHKALKHTVETEAVAQQATIFVNFISLLVQMLGVDLKKQQLEVEKIELLAYLLYEWWQQAPVTLAQNADFTKIRQSQQWLSCCKACLKIGMHVNEAEVDLPKADRVNGLLLKLLAYLAEQLYKDFAVDAEDQKQQQQSAEPAQLFEMICTHSKFHDIVLSQSPTAVKTAVMQLLYILAKKSPSAALSNAQIPVILGSYQAKLSDADRYALALLQLYELHDCGLQQYRPFIWGESAIAFYALRSADEDRVKLSQQETSIAQVMSLIDKQVCEYTIDNFPIWRKLDAAQQLPSVQFANPSLKALTFGANHLERSIELGRTAFDASVLRLCPKRSGVYEQCYDPAFFMPLLSMCFAPEACVHAVRPVQNGALSLAFAALSSQDKEMRLAAGSVQLRYRSHFEQGKFFERPLWTQAYDNIQSGLSDLRVSWQKHKQSKSSIPRAPFVPALFVAKTFNLTTDPTHLLYKHLTMYLRLKSSFNFQCVPEFNVLFYSPEIEHHSFRQFIVEVIRAGIKSTADLFLLVSTNTFKVLMGFYGGSMSTLEMNLLILSLFSTCVKIPASTKLMIEHVGILPWLHAIIGSIEFYHFDIIEGLISIINNLWYALQANAAQFHNMAHISLEIHRLILLLLPHLSARISSSNFAKLLNIMHKTSAAQHLGMSATQLDQLIDCSHKHFPAALVHSIASIKTLGGAGAASHNEYCQALHRQQLDPVATLALSSLRAYVIEWWLCQQRPQRDLLNVSTD